MNQTKTQQIQEIKVLDFPHKDDKHLKIVFGKMGNEWGTWEKNIDREVPEYYWGHYFDSEEKALKDFETRCEGLGIKI